MLGYLLLLVAGVLLLRWLVVGDWLPGGDAALSQLGYLLLISAMVASWLVQRQGRMGVLLRQVAGWLGVVCLLVLMYGYRHELGGVKARFLATLMPGRAVAQQSAGQVQIVASQGGHFRVMLTINGEPIPFLVDTGASAIVLAPQVLSRLGLDRRKLRFTQPFQTANGQVFNAPVILQDVQLGDLHLQRVPAVVNQTAMDNSLLGMSFFKRLKSYRVDAGVMTLYW
ncbi:conserved hypothetical 25.1 kDa protein in CobV 5'region (orf1) [Magnetococcus marinus MC-1]|uniref:Conserved hypothetical 25.1 kDa protein in CobV 5'region (Orf1) n=1 Tax=Magnetococcus marinus (strain ATCC BAA-1437 / JCM 17883 / MC-1) TaxID=156889 RepID=A0LAI0_MAGMM|nr:TIGR02281 family clan AA aspartic protease [Magnetococcus marinus]ABK44973.1 conserved hypothetical 25.1 kDa protein in CobV 5'region (orf1) [Magnetococcus marinus MC-1]